MRDWGDAIGFLAAWITIILVLVGFFWMLEGQYRQTTELRVEAVKRGYAEWVVDAEGHTEFRWLDAPTTATVER
jgi:hypothetical protein